MTSLSSNRSSMTVSYNGFKGIDRSVRNTGKGILSDIVNFTVSSDGTLKKRPCFSFKATFASQPRAIYPLDGQGALMLAGNNFGILDTESFSFSIKRFIQSSDDASFFCYDGEIYLLSGNGIYVYRGGTMEPVNGYAPLYGMEWDPVNCGEIYEDQNLLSDRIRISYRITSGSPTRFFSKLPIKSVDAVYVNNKPIATSRFVIADGALSIENGITLDEGDEITFYLTTENTPTGKSALTSCVRAAIYGSNGDRGATASSVAFYRGDSEGSIICTRRISRDSYDSSSKAYPNAPALYVTFDDILTVGNGGAMVTATCRRDNRLLVFTDHSAFALTESESSSYLFLLSDSNGCTSVDCALAMMDTPVTVSSDGILLWSPSAYDSVCYSAKCISDPIIGLPSKEFFRNSIAFPHSKKSELWFSDPNSVEKRVFIYNTKLKCWYSYSGINADKFFDLKGVLGFFSGYDIFLFGSEKTYDEYSDATILTTASFSLDSVNFGEISKKKRLCRLKMQTVSGGTVSARITDASGNATSLYLVDTGEESVGLIDTRTSPVARSRYYSVKVSCYGNDAPEINALSLIAVN